jgi:hypothetical protein
VGSTQRPFDGRTPAVASLDPSRSFDIPAGAPAERVAAGEGGSAECDQSSCTGRWQRADARANTTEPTIERIEGPLPRESVSRQKENGTA